MIEAASTGLSVVIPVFNSAPILDPLVARLHTVLDGLTREYELVLVNDGSGDASGRLIGELAQRYQWIQAIELMRNYGQHNALLCGIRLAKYPIVVTMDDDLQHPPEEIPRLLAVLEEGHDVVYGAPDHEQHGFMRNVASQLTKLALGGAMGHDIVRQVGAFRAFRTELRDAFSQYQGSFVSIDVLLTWGTTRFAATLVHHEPRAVGKSNYTLLMLVRHALNMVTGFSTVPLQLASLMGFLMTLFGILILVYVLGRLITEGGSVPGFPFLASVISIFSGTQLFALGMIGEYLARMHFRMMGKPAYTIRCASTSR